ncbi:MAG: pilus assembly protein PilP [Deltaproteobacteria bacterium]|nr:pilus assembly protein PilP [Deltaproteobacteria bacterium]
MIISVCLLLSLWGCKDEPAPPPPKPAIVKQKINLKEAAAPPKVTDTKKPVPAAGSPLTAAQQAKTVSELKSEPMDHSRAIAPKEPSDITQSAKSETAKEAASTIAPVISLRTRITDTSRRYNPEGKIDPFDPLIKDRVTDFGKTRLGEPKRPLTPLEKIDLSQLKLVGIIRAGSGNKALVQDATGKGYIVTNGTHIGIHSGKVTKIERDRLLVQELAEDIFGRPKKSQKELKLQKPPGEE